MDTYEKKYKDAFERAKEFYILCKKCGAKDTVDFLKDTFPELAESEDEKIKKWLICGMNALKEQRAETFATIPIDDAIAWLEKQGEKKPFDYENANIQQKDFAPKIEPKFKIGDWVIDKQGIVHQIANVIEIVTCHTYGYDIVGGGYFNDNTEGVRLWTIQDAKDGDVLYCKSDCGVEFIVMSKGVNNRNNIDSYFRYNSDDGFGIDIPNVLSAKQDNITPSTKEQRDILFKKMKEAGFEWDSEKKELKKISQRMISAEAKEAMYDKPTDNDMVEALRTEYEKGRADAIAEMEKPTWSDEDVYNSKLILSTINQDQDLSLKTKDKLTSWIKSIKQRIGG